MAFRYTTATFTFLLESPGIGILCYLAQESGLLCGFSPHKFEDFVFVSSYLCRIDFLQTPPRGKCPCHWLAVNPLLYLVKGDSPTEDFHLIRTCPCRAYTRPMHLNKSSDWRRKCLGSVRPKRVTVNNKKCGLDL